MDTTTSRERSPRGRTIGILVVVAAIVIVAAILCVPRYQRHRHAAQVHAAKVRAQVAEGLASSDPARLAVALYLARFHLAPADNTAAGLAFSEELGSRYVKGVQVDDGKLVVTYGNKADAAIGGKTIQLVPHKDADGVTRWTCSSGDIDPDYLPADCR